jgi:hypothetical protein
MTRGARRLMAQNDLQGAARNKTTSGGTSTLRIVTMVPTPCRQEFPACLSNTLGLCGRSCRFRSLDRLWQLMIQRAVVAIQATLPMPDLALVLSPESLGPPVWASVSAVELLLGLAARGCTSDWEIETTSYYRE